MIGWTADFFRFWWALVYWNARKTWFRLNGAHRDSCPCQTFSDSGLALDSRCAAAAGWRDPRRFRKACPLLVETQEGWRCSVDAERVRPFWGRALLYSGGALLVLYLAAATAFYARLRKTGHEVGYLTVAWPGYWPQLRHTEEQLQTTRAQEALAAGNFPAAMASLEIICRLNPANHNAGIALAALKQITGQVDAAEAIYERLMQDIPDQRSATAQLWFRLLLARADYARIKTLAGAMLSEDSGRREVWLDALIFAARQTDDASAVGALLTGEHGLPEWCLEEAGIEQLILQNHVDRALPRLNRRFPVTVANHLPYYQVDRLLRLGRPEQAADLLGQYGSRLGAEDTAFLRLRVALAKGGTAGAETELDALLKRPLSAHLATLISAYLLANPDSPILPRYVDVFLRSGPALASETLPLYHATYLLAAGADPQLVPKLESQIARFSGSDAKPLQALARARQTHAPPAQPTEILPLVPLPTEVIYALLEQAHAASR